MFKEYEEARKILYEEIDKDWIDSKIKERRKYLRELQRRHGKYALFYEKENRCHPFAEWWLDSSLYGIIRIIMLASLLKTLKSCKGFKEKIETLKADPRGFEKYIYELRIAYDFVQFGGNVTFSETPDLIVSQRDVVYYVECKKKDIYGGKEKKIKNFFKVVSERVMRKWKNIRSPLVIFVKCEASIELKDKPRLEKLIKSAVAKDEEETRLSEENFEVIVKNPKTANHVMKVSYVDYSMNTEEEINQRFIYSLTKAALGFSVNPDYCTFEGDINPQNDGFLLRNLRFIGFLSNESRSRFKSIEDSFDEAIGQIPKERNGLIYIEVGPRISPYEVRDISERLKGKLKDYPRINAVLLTREITEKPTEEDLIKGTYYVKILNEKSSIPEYLKIPGVRGEEIKDSEKRVVLEDLVRKYTPEGFRPFSKDGSTLVFAFRPYLQNKVQYYIDIGNESDKNRVSLFHDGKSSLVLKIYSFNGKCYSAEIPLNKEEFFDKDHVVLSTWNSLRGLIEINVDGKKYRKNVDTFYLRDITVRMLIGTDISKKYFAKMLLYSVQIYARPFEDKETLEFIQKLCEQFKVS